MNNPYPSASRLRAEATADRLLAEQAATRAFRAIVSTAQTAIAALCFPLGCPAPGHDMDDVTGTLAEWLLPQDERLLDDLADDAARDRMAA